VRKFVSLSVLAVTMTLTGCAVDPFAGNSPASDNGLINETSVSPTAGLSSPEAPNYGWELVGTPKLTLEMGIISAHAQVRNGGNTRSATIQLIYDLNGKPLVLHGAVSNVDTGKTVPVIAASEPKMSTLPKGRPQFRVTVAY
jgi:hypothetical protein